MTALIIIAAIAAIIVVALCTHAGVGVQYGEKGFGLTVRYGFIRLRILPPKKGKTEKVVAETAVQAEDKLEKLGGNFPRLIEIAKIGVDALGRLRRKLVIDELTVRVAYGCEDAADTAIRYGAASVAMGNLIPLLENAFKLRRRNIELTPVFGQSTLTVWLRARASVALGSLLYIAIIAAYKYLKFDKNTKKPATE